MTNESAVENESFICLMIGIVIGIVIGFVLGWVVVSYQSYFHEMERGKRESQKVDSYKGPTVAKPKYLTAPPPRMGNQTNCDCHKPLLSIRQRPDGKLL